MGVSHFDTVLCPVHLWYLNLTRDNVLFMLCLINKTKILHYAYDYKAKNVLEERGDRWSQIAHSFTVAAPAQDSKPPLPNTSKIHKNS